MLSLVLSDDESCCAGTGEEGDDGRANRHDEIPDESLHVVAHNLHCFFKCSLFECFLNVHCLNVYKMLFSNFSNWENIFPQLGK